MSKLSREQQRLLSEYCTLILQCEACQEERKTSLEQDTRRSLVEIEQELLELER